MAKNVFFQSSKNESVPSVRNVMLTGFAPLRGVVMTIPIIYPVCQVANPEADEAETAAAADFLAFLQTQVCLDAYEEYCFIING